MTQRGGHRSGRRGARGRRWAAALILALAVSVVLAPELVGLAQTMPFLALVTFRPAIAVGLLLLAGLTAMARRRWWPAAAAVALTAVLALGFVVATRALVTARPAAGGRPLTVLSFNVDEGQADVAALAGTIRGARPDLVVLPEAGDGFERRLLPTIPGMGYRAWTTGRPGSADVDGIVVLAGPALGDITVDPAPGGEKFRWLRLAGGALRGAHVIAAHSAAPLPGQRRRWLADTRALGDWCATGDGPSVVIGDLNATLDQAPFRSATSGCVDATAAVGRGLIATWPTSSPRWLGVQIDHVLTSGGIRAASADVLDLPGSDHRAVLAEILL